MLQFACVKLVELSQLGLHVDRLRPYPLTSTVHQGERKATYVSGGEFAGPFRLRWPLWHPPNIRASRLCQVLSSFDPWHTCTSPKLKASLLFRMDNFSSKIIQALTCKHQMNIIQTAAVQMACICMKNVKQRAAFTLSKRN